MNFGEKLTKLRKQKGLSQEELGYELNVTRQTISKWELGQTTPEMEKLVEMSKIFGVTVDELTSEGEAINNETQKIEDRPINDRPQNNSTLKVILLIVAIFVIGGMIVFGVLFSKVFNFGKGVFDKASNQAEEIGNMISGTIQNQIEKVEDIEKESEEFRNQVSEQMNEFQKENEEEQEEFNQMYNEASEMINDIKKDMNAGEQDFDQMKNQVLEMMNNF